MQNLQEYFKLWSGFFLFETFTTRPPRISCSTSIDVSSMQLLIATAFSLIASKRAKGRFSAHFYLPRFGGMTWGWFSFCWSTWALLFESVLTATVASIFVVCAIDLRLLVWVFEKLRSFYRWRRESGLEEEKVLGMIGESGLLFSLTWISFLRCSKWFCVP